MVHSGDSTERKRDSSSAVPVLLALLLVLAAAAFLRMYQLDSIPPGLSPDVAANGVDALEILQGKFPAFLERNGGREPLLMYLIALDFLLFGASPWAIFFTTAVVGVITVLFTYLLARQLFRSELIAILASGWLAISYWHVNFTRSGLRASTLPLMVTVTIYCLWRGWSRQEKHSLFWYSIGGLGLGLSLYTYLPARFLPVLVGLTFLLGFFRQRKLSLQYWYGPVTTGVCAFLVFLPLGFYFAINPDSFSGRAAEVSIFNEMYNQGNAFTAWLTGAGKTVAMFFLYGDGNWRHNLPYRPIFDPLTSILCLVGIAVVLRNISRSEYFFSLLWVGVMFLPATLTAEGMPNSLRAMGLLPVMYLFPAIGVSWLKERFFATTRRAVPLYSLLIVLFVFGAGVTYDTYFNKWGPSQNAKDAVEAEFTPIVAGLNQAASPDAPYIIPVSNALRPGYRHFTLDFLYHGLAPLNFLQVDDATAAGELAGMVKGWGRVILLEWYDTYLVDADPRGVLTFMLEMNARRISEQSFKGFKLVTFQLIENPRFFLQPSSLIQGSEHLGEGMSLKGFSYGAGSRTDESGVWIAISWGSQGQTRKDLKSSVRLQDLQGKTLVQKDKLLLDNSHRYTSGWDAGSEAIDLTYLSFPSDLPQGAYRIAAVLYDPISMQQFGQQIVLGSVKLPADGPQ